jgi:hypothetical protein
VSVVCACLVGCGSDGDGSSVFAGGISGAPLTGKIDNQPWTFVAGQTDAFLSSTGDQYFANLFDMPFSAPCAALQPQGATRSIILNLPKTAGHYSLSLQLNQTFSYDDGTGTSQNDIATIGALDVTEISATTIRGGVRMAYGAKDAVDGQFEITICTM